MRVQRTAIGVVAGVGSVGVLVGLAAGQAVQTRPGPGRDIIQVEGTVAVTNTPSVAVSNNPIVRAEQAGDWKVRQVGDWKIGLVAPSFLREGQTYRLTWQSGQQEDVTVKTIADGWMLADRTEAGVRVSRWINPAQAIAIETR